MPDLSSDNPVIALAVADLHLTAEAPIARSGEPSWEEVVRRQFEELKQLSFSHGTVPILCAGDVFDKWNASAETINLALSHMPRMFAVPGQHDLPYHELSEVHKTAFGVLVKAGKLELVVGRRVVGVPGVGSFVLHGYPWGVPVEGVSSGDSELTPHIAIIHAYCWNGNAKHPEASERSELRRFKLKGLQTAIFGDNHKSFDALHQDCRVFNCGGFFRRKSDEICHRPRVGMIRLDGSVETHYLDTSKDIFVSTTAKDFPKTEELVGVAEFVEGLTTMEKGSVDFVEALEVFQKTHRLSPVASRLLRQLTDES